MFRLSAQGLVRSLKLKFRQDFDADVWSVFCCWCLVGLWSWFLVEILKLKFYGDVDVWLIFYVDACSRFWGWTLIKICVRTRDMNATLGSVVPLAIFHFIHRDWKWHECTCFFFKQIAEHLGQISNERDLWSTSINFINSVFWSLLKTSLRTTPACTSRCLVMKIRSSKDEWSTESNNHLWSTDLFRS